MYASQLGQMFHGGRTNTDGACPGCGQAVERQHVWSTMEATDTYDCPRCGTFTYGTNAAMPAQTVIFEAVEPLTTQA